MALNEENAPLVSWADGPKQKQKSNGGRLALLIVVGFILLLIIGFLICYCADCLPCGLGGKQKEKKANGVDGTQDQEVVSPHQPQPPAPQTILTPLIPAPATPNAAPPSPPKAPQNPCEHAQYNTEQFDKYLAEFELTPKPNSQEAADWSALVELDNGCEWWYPQKGTFGYEFVKQALRTGGLGSSSGFLARTEEETVPLTDDVSIKVNGQWVFAQNRAYRNRGVRVLSNWTHMGEQAYAYGAADKSDKPTSGRNPFLIRKKLFKTPMGQAAFDTFMNAKPDATKLQEAGGPAVLYEAMYWLTYISFVYEFPADMSTLGEFEDPTVDSLEALKNKWREHVKMRNILGDFEGGKVFKLWKVWNAGLLGTTDVVGVVVRPSFDKAEHDSVFTTLPVNEVDVKRLLNGRAAGGPNAGNGIATLLSVARDMEFTLTQEGEDKTKAFKVKWDHLKEGYLYPAVYTALKTQVESMTTRVRMAEMTPFEKTSYEALVTEMVQSAWHATHQNPEGTVAAAKRATTSFLKYRSKNFWLPKADSIGEWWWWQGMRDPRTQLSFQDLHEGSSRASRHGAKAVFLLKAEFIGEGGNLDEEAWLAMEQRMDVSYLKINTFLTEANHRTSESAFSHARLWCEFMFWKSSPGGDRKEIYDATTFWDFLNIDWVDGGRPKDSKQITCDQRNKFQNAAQATDYRVNRDPVMGS